MTEFASSIMPLALMLASVGVGVLAGLVLRRMFGVSRGDRLC